MKRHEDDDFKRPCRECEATTLSIGEMEAGTRLDRLQRPRVESSQCVDKRSRCRLESDAMRSNRWESLE